MLKIKKYHYFVSESMRLRHRLNTLTNEQKDVCCFQVWGVARSVEISENENFSIGLHVKCAHSSETETAITAGRVCSSLGI